MPATAMMPVVLIPGLGGSLRSFAPILPMMWRHGPVTIADHTRDETIAAIAVRILRDAPPRFALAGHSMGGYIAFEIMRQAPERVARLALICTQARSDTPEAAARRQAFTATLSNDKPYAVLDALWPNLVHPSRVNDALLKQVMRDMRDDVGAEAYMRQQAAVIGRIDSRPTLATIECPTLVLSADQDNIIPNSLSVEMAQGIHGATLTILKECGHMATIEQPEAAASALTGWIAG